MTRSRPLDRAALNRLLRRGDPARELPADEALRLRQRVLREAARDRLPARARGARGWTLAAAGVLLALAVGLQRGAVDRPDGAEKRTRIAATEPAAGWKTRYPAREEELAVRPYQVQFSTPGGTRIIWLLVPEEPQDRRPL